MSSRRSIHVDLGRTSNAFSNSNIYATSEVVSLLGSIPTGCNFETHSLGYASVVAVSISTEYRLWSINMHYVKRGTLSCDQVAGKVTFQLEPKVNKEK
jgi:hypothetical protein